MDKQCVKSLDIQYKKKKKKKKKKKNIFYHQIIKKDYKKILSLRNKQQKMNIYILLIT